MLRVLIATVALLVWAGTAQAEKRVALVIGNAGYKLLPALANPKNDARLMATTLTRVGFDVVTAIDVDARSMLRAVDRFTRSLRNAGKGSVGLFYYSGHGAQTEGNNYLIPLAAEIESPKDLDFAALSVSQILSQMEDSGSEQNIIILDAGRSNPYNNGKRATARGLARMDAGTGSLIVTSATPGHLALDGDGANSTFTSALAAEITIPGLSVEHVFRRVQSEVRRRTGGRQIPWQVSSLVSDFRFVSSEETVEPVQIGTTAPKPSPEPNPDQSSTAKLETMLWNAVKDGDNSKLLRSFVNRYPNGRFSELARVRLEQLKRKEAAEGSSNGVTRGDLTNELPVAEEPTVPAKPQAASVLPDFPWPPPEPSVKMRLPRQPFAKATDLKTVSAHLVAPLRKAGYWEYSFHRVPNGFALVTRLERINEDGSQVTEDIRHRLPGDEETFSLTSYIKRLFFAAPGYYRLIVFVVTDRPFTATGNPIKEKDALELLRGGANALPSEFTEMEFSTAYGIDALIYEFRKGAGDQQVNFLLPGRISPQVHLRNAGLSAAFGLQ